MEIWNNLISLSKTIEDIFDKNFECTPIPANVNFSGWRDTYWKSDQIRKCHLKTIDKRETQKLWLMHINIFPNEDIGAPILGFDVVAGSNKITGAFFDYSPIEEDHELVKYYNERVNNISWNKPRELPEWAQSIFSKNIIAAGNIRTEEEINQLSSTCLDLINYYVKNISNCSSSGNYKEKQNYYCKQQKLNTHLHKSLNTMGISEAEKDEYINKVLFEEI